MRDSDHGSIFDQPHVRERIAQVERERDEARAEVARLTAARLSREGIDVSVLVGYEAGQREVLRLRLLLREAVEDLLGDIGHACLTPCPHDECRWLRAATAALEGRDG